MQVRWLAPSLLALAMTGWAARSAGSEPLPAARASFPLLSEKTVETPARSSPLDRLTPRARASLPAAAVPAPAPPPPAPPAPAPSEPTGATRWDWVRRPAPTVSTEPEARRRGDARPEIEDRAEPRRDRDDDWMLSLEGVTHAPIDVGLQAGLETPGGLRLFAGYGWVPSFYLGRITAAASLASGDPRLRAVLDGGLESGRAWRIQAGIRPFSRVGVYLDAGYSRVSLSGSLDSAELSGIPELAGAGSYAIDSTLHLGFAELGYQAKIADRIVLALGLGVTKVFAAETRVEPSGGAPDDPALGQATGVLDDGLETYGVLPTLTLRLGVDLI